MGGCHPKMNKMQIGGNSKPLEGEKKQNELQDPLFCQEGSKIFMGIQIKSPVPESESST